MFPERFLEQPLSFDADPSGRAVALDRGGRRLCVAEPGEAQPRAFELAEPARRCRLHGKRVALLEEDRIRSVDLEGASIGTLKVRPGALNLAVAGSGSLLVSYGRRAPVTLERLGEAPLRHVADALLDAPALAVESGGFWLAGTGAGSPPARAVRLRPVRDGLKERAQVPLPAPPRAAAIGPDGALYVVLEPGEALVRVADGACGPVARLDSPVAELARCELALWGCGARGLVDLTRLVPPPEDRPEIELPGCS